MAIDQSRYTQQRGQVNSDHLSKQAANERGRFLSQKRGNRQTADATRGFGRSQRGFMGNQASRGLTGGGVSSGVFQRQLQQRVGDHTRNMGRLADDLGEEQRGFDINSGNIDRMRNQALLQIEQDRASEIAMQALQLKALKPLYG
jgi:hypothetical protein